MAYVIAMHLGSRLVAVAAVVVAVAAVVVVVVVVVDTGAFVAAFLLQ